MLLCFINNGYEQIYINSKNNKITCNLVNNNGITHLDYFDFSSLFNTNKRYIESSNGYDIYIDESNLKRYYKDGIEDFNMFYLNNGIDASISFNSKRERITSKIFVFIVSGITSLVLFSDSSMNDLLENDKYKTISYSIDTDYYEPVTLEHLREYICRTKGLSEELKDFLYNEDYLSYLLSISNDSRKLYDLNNRFDDIKVVCYESSELPGSLGYYDCSDQNTIHLLENIVDDEKTKKDIAAHEFIHLTQCTSSYGYLLDSIAEIMSYEFYGSPNLSYIEEVKRTKMLMEIIGTEPVLNSVYSYDTTLFENSIKKYLDDIEAEEFLQLMSFDFYDQSKKDDINKRVTELLYKMLRNKHKDDEDAYNLDTLLFKNILKDNVPGRLYFNSNKDLFYEPYSLGGTYSCTEKHDCVGFDEDIILSKGTPTEVYVSGIFYSKKQLLEILNKPGFSDFINKFQYLFISSPKDSSSNTEFRCNGGGLYSVIEPNDTKNTFTDKIRNLLDILEMCDDKSVITFHYGNLKCDSISYDEFLEHPYIYKEQSISRFKINDKLSAYYTGDSINFSLETDAIVPSIHDKFGVVYPEKIEENKIVK